jgi:hypothetical protein
MMELFAKVGRFFVGFANGKVVLEMRAIYLMFCHS